MNKVEVVKTGIFDLQVCVEKSLSDEEVSTQTNTISPAGTENGWMMKKEGEESLNGDPYRAQCHDHEDRVHIMFQC